MYSTRKLMVQVERGTEGASTSTSASGRKELFVELALLLLLVLLAMPLACDTGPRTRGNTGIEADALR